MRRTPEQVFRSMDAIARDLTVAGLLGQARRLRRLRTEMRNFVYSEKLVPRKIKRRSKTPMFDLVMGGFYR